MSAKIGSLLDDAKVENPDFGFSIVPNDLKAT